MYLNSFFNTDDLPQLRDEVPDSRAQAPDSFPFELAWSKGPAEVYGAPVHNRFPDGGTCEIRGVLERSEEPQLFRMTLDDGLDLPLKQVQEANETHSDLWLTWHLFPQFSGAYDYTWASTYVALDLVFSDGSRLSDYQLKTRDGVPVQALAQGRSRVLIPRQWNRLDVNLTAASELTDRDLVIEGIELTIAIDGLDALENGVLSPLAEQMPATAQAAWRDAAGEKLARADVQAYLGPILIQPQAVSAAREPVDYVNILRGTNDSRQFSRGLTVPAVAVPQGFNFFCPTTLRPEPKDLHILYDYMSHRFTGISISHEPSVWVGDRATFQFMAASEPVEHLDEEGRAAFYTHETELPRPYAYEISDLATPASSVDLGVAPTMHGAIFRFAFHPEAIQNMVILDSIRERELGRLTLDTETRDRFTAVLHDVNNGMQPLYLVGLFDRPWQRVQAGQAMQAGFIFGSGEQVVTLRIGTSFIDEATAWEALADEVGSADYAGVKQEAKALWNKQLAVLDVLGGGGQEHLPEAQLEAIYSNLYRLYLYPNTLHETKRPSYRSPYADDAGQHPVRKGKLYYNNGFWDTYRTAWPAYALFTPKLATELADGTIEHWRASGWIPRWVAPGGTDSMVGTSADIILADLASRGVLENAKLRREAWLATVKDGNQVSFNTVDGGRKDAYHAFFDGFMSVETREGLSWSLEGNLNDYGLALLAYDQGERDLAAYFARRARNHQRLFWVDADGRGWYRGRTRDGELPDTDFNPIAWGGDYTETDAWNMAFTAVHDSAELLRLHGGADAFTERLDELMSYPGTFEIGGYGGVIHEMLEAREIKIGRLGVSNQPSHHLPSMYQFAGRPDRASLILRDIARRGQAGGNFGQGYIGDEDNGEMSAFYLFATLGLYPLIPGVPIYSLTAPLLPAADLRMDSGKQLKIRVIGDPQHEDYIRAVLWNGEPWTKSYITHQQLADGGTLTYVLASQPSDWGRDTVYPSLDDLIGDAPMWVDALDGDYMYRAEGISLRVNAATTQRSLAPLTDNDSRTELYFALDDPKGEGALVFEFPAAQRVEALTLTSGAEAGEAPSSVKLQSADEPYGPWEDLLESPLRFTAGHQTLPFTVPASAERRWYRVVFRQDAPTLAARLLKREADPHRNLALAELELLVEYPETAIARVPEE